MIDIKDAAVRSISNGESAAVDCAGFADSIIVGELWKIDVYRNYVCVNVCGYIYVYTLVVCVLCVKIAWEELVVVLSGKGTLPPIRFVAQLEFTFS